MLLAMFTTCKKEMTVNKSQNNGQGVNRHRVAQKIFNGKNLFVISSWIEEALTDAGWKIYEDVVFFEFTEGYDTNKKVIMALSSSDLRSMVYGIRELLKNGETSYRKFTDPKLAGGSGAKKEISFAKDEKKNYYINLTSGVGKVGFAFDVYAFAGLIDSLILIAEETEKALYWYQRS